jgi:hypothetical protein
MGTREATQHTSYGLLATHITSSDQAARWRRHYRCTTGHNVGMIMTTSEDIKGSLGNEFRYSIPILTSEGQDDDKYEPYLYLKASRALLHFGPTLEGTRSNLTTSLHERAEN